MFERGGNDGARRRPLAGPAGATSEDGAQSLNVVPANQAVSKVGNFSLMDAALFAAPQNSL